MQTAVPLDGGAREALPSVKLVESKANSPRARRAVATVRPSASSVSRPASHSFRAAVTGKTRGPELARTLPLIGKERIVKRIKMATKIS